MTHLVRHLIRSPRKVHVPAASAKPAVVAALPRRAVATPTRPRSSGGPFAVSGSSTPGSRAFARHGFSGVSIEQLCTAARVSTRAFYEEFTTKVELLAALHDQLNDRAVEAVIGALDEVDPLDLGARATAGCTAYVEEFTRDLRWAKVVLVEAVGVSPAMEARRQRAVDGFAQLIRAEADRLAAAGAMPPHDHALAAGRARRGHQGARDALGCVRAHEPGRRRGGGGRGGQARRSRAALVGRLRGTAVADALEHRIAGGDAGEGPCRTTDMTEVWNSEATASWVTHPERYDQMLAPFGDRVLDAAALQVGERVLDVGCGSGQLTRAAAAVVGPDAHVVGVDVSGPLIELARSLSTGDSISYVQADGQTAAIDGGPFDVLISRFGVMFFADPVAAFTNLRRHMSPAGRLAFVAWQALPVNEWAVLPVASVIDYLGLPDAPPPGAPGPFAFGEPDRARSSACRGWLGTGRGRADGHRGAPGRRWERR